MEATSPGKLRVADDHLADPTRLRALFADEGYLYFRDVLDRAAIKAVNRRMVRVLVEQGVAEPAGPAPAWSGLSPAEFMEHEEPELQRLLGAHRLWERLVETPQFEAFFTGFVGAPASFIPLARYRIAPPGSTTSAHRDAALNPGFDMTTAWIPLMSIDTTLGGLALVPGSHRDEGWQAAAVASPAEAPIPGRACIGR